jgi:hypothetical protein
MRQRCGVYVAQDVLVATLAGGYVSTRQKLATGRARVRRTPSSRLDARAPNTWRFSVPSKDAGAPLGPHSYMYCSTTRKRNFIPQDTYHGCERLERFCFRGLWEVRFVDRFLAYSLSAPTADSVGILRHEPAENGQQHPRWVQPGASRAERTHIHLLCGCEELFSARSAYALQHG